MNGKIRLGILIPSSNTTMEEEFNEMKSKNMTVHSARMKLKEVTIKSLTEMEREAEREALKLADANVNVIAYGCTTGSLVKGVNHATEIEAKLESITGIPSIATANAVLRAMRKLGLRKISVATPYIEELNERERRFLELNGIKVLKIVGLGLKDNVEIGRVKSETVQKLALKANVHDADGIFISCTNLRTINIIEKLEREIGKPVISSNTATFWNMLRRINVNERIKGYGILLSKI